MKAVICRARPTVAVRSLRSDHHSINEVMRMIRPIVLSGPSGGGKSTIFEMARKSHPNAFALCVSHTTRQPREGETDGFHYHFTDRPTMRQMIENGDFFEYAEFSGNIYGTSKKAVEAVQKTGKICILDLELQGVRNVHKSHLDAKYILIRAPSIKALEERLQQRGTETEESLKRRLKHAQQDLDAVAKEPALFDHVIVNDVLDVAYKKFLEVIAEELDQLDASRSG